MTKPDFIELVAKNMNTTKINAHAAINGVIESIQEVVASGERLQLVGFGTFETTEISAHEGHNPATGEKVNIPARKQVKFKAGKLFKEVVNA